MSLENRGILLKRTSRNINSQEGEHLNFLRPLMTAGLPLGLIAAALGPEWQH